MDAETRELMRLIDATLARLERVRARLDSHGLQESARRTATNLSTLRSTVEAGKLPRPSRGENPMDANLGLSRFIGEWCDDEELLAHVREIERYYRETF